MIGFGGQLGFAMTARIDLVVIGLLLLQRGPGSISDDLSSRCHVCEVEGLVCLVAWTQVERVLAILH